MHYGCLVGVGRPRRGKKRDPWIRTKANHQTVDTLGSHVQAAKKYLNSAARTKLPPSNPSCQPGNAVFKPC